MRHLLPLLFLPLLPAGLTACGSAADAHHPSAAELSEDPPPEPFEMGCTGFDPDLVPATYITMKPCLQQLRWTLHVTRTKTMVFQDDTAQMDMRDDFDVSARGQQLVWRWEENGSSAGNYLLSGQNNTVSELLVQRSGNASLNGHARFTDRVRNQAASEQIAVAGPVDGTLLVALGAAPGEPACVGFHVDTQMRGRYSIALTPSATPERSESGAFLATAFERTPDDVWNIKDEFRSFRVCAGPPRDAASERFDAGEWSGLAADDAAGVWRFSGDKTIALPDSTQTEHWTIDLLVQRVARTARPAAGTP